jgi:tetratricopeptide (TPR) repeat protein
MATPFLSSEEYDERAHRLYDEGDFEAALETLNDGVRLYPHSVELYVGLGYTRLAREEYVWAKQAFQRALVLDPEHEEGIVGMGEALLRFGNRADALRLFRQVREGGTGDVDLLLSMGRALYRERLYAEALDVLGAAATEHGQSAEVAAALGYTLHRQGEEDRARRELRRALKLDVTHHEARVYLAHMLYDRGDWAGALREFERVPESEHWDALAVARLLELKRALQGYEAGAAELAELESRLEELEQPPDPLEELLAEIEQAAEEARSADGVGVAEPGPPHCVQLTQGGVCTGSWYDIVRQMRDVSGLPGESVAQFMRRRAAEERARSGVQLPSEDPREFLLAGSRAGYWHVEY